MLFNSYSFLVFFPVVCLIYFVLPRKSRWIWLLVASYYFYMSWNPIYVLLIATSTGVTYLAGILIENMRTSGNHLKMVVAGTLMINLAILVYFKYINFLLSSFNQLFGWLHGTELGMVDIVLPVGISFYTFQAIGYTIDVYRGEVKAERNLFKYALFVSFFPQLVAGPIERSKNLLTQIKESDKCTVWDYDRITTGLITMLWGFFLKMVISDRISIYVDKVFDEYTAYSSPLLVLAAIGFAIQIYCDFGGYSAIAIGAAKVLGFDLIENFRMPYLATSISDFWKRWHISLSSWFRDYVYIPLGGNRGKTWKRYRNIMITFLVSGLWHGASWHFVVWGGLHGLMQVVEYGWKGILRAIGRDKRESSQDSVVRFIQVMTTFALVVIAWVFFRAPSVKDAICYVMRMFRISEWPAFDWNMEYAVGMASVEGWILLGSVAGLLVMDYFCNRTNRTAASFIIGMPLVVRWSVLLVLLFACVVFGIYGPGFDASQFIYFQF